MRKGRLVEAVLADPTVQWEQIFASLALQGRHRSKRRWRCARRRSSENNLSGGNVV